eukprot:7387832-Prymnesium_polylepis.2
MHKPAIASDYCVLVGVGASETRGTRQEQLPTSPVQLGPTSELPRHSFPDHLTSGRCSRGV